MRGGGLPACGAVVRDGRGGVPIGRAGSGGWRAVTVVQLVAGGRAQMLWCVGQGDGGRTVRCGAYGAALGDGLVGWGFVTGRRGAWWRGRG